MHPPRARGAKPIDLLIMNGLQRRNPLSRLSPPLPSCIHPVLLKLSNYPLRSPYLVYRSDSLWLVKSFLSYWSVRVWVQLLKVFYVLLLVSYLLLEWQMPVPFLLRATARKDLILPAGSKYAQFFGPRLISLIVDWNSKRSVLIKAPIRDSIAPISQREPFPIRLLGKGLTLLSNESGTTWGVDPDRSWSKKIPFSAFFVVGTRSKEALCNTHESRTLASKAALHIRGGWLWVK